MTEWLVQIDTKRIGWTPEKIMIVDQIFGLQTVFGFCNYQIENSMVADKF